MPSTCRPSHLAIDVGACVENLARLRRHVDGKDLWPVVKADGYGHGAAQVATALARERVAGFCVATVSEARVLREAGLEQAILVLSGLSAAAPEDAFDEAVRLSLDCAVADAATARRLATSVEDHGAPPARVHLKADTGMGRLGVRPEGVSALAAAIAAEPALALEGLFSSLSTADSLASDGPEAELVERQAQTFGACCQALEESELLPRHRTLANSAALLQHPCTWRADWATGGRPGVALYGASLTYGHDPIALRPAMSLRTRVAALRMVPEGSPVGYGLAASTRRETRVGVLPLGYHDGLPVSASPGAEVWIRGVRAPLIGRISMDITLVDLTDVGGAAVGDRVVVFGDVVEGFEGGGYVESLSTALRGIGELGDEEPAAPASMAPPSVEEFARGARSFPHEVLACMGPRLPRRYVDGREGAS